MIGTGVATGQEILQYYTANGWMIFGTAVVIAIIFIVANYGFALAGHIAQNSPDEARSALYEWMSKQGY